MPMHCFGGRSHICLLGSTSYDMRSFHGGLEKGFVGSFFGVALAFRDLAQPRTTRARNC